jgi:hypothetical protein
MCPLVGWMDLTSIFDSVDEDSGDEFDDELSMILVVLDISEDNENTKMSARNLPLRGAMYITCMLNGNPTLCKEMFRMEPPEFIALCSELRECQLMRSARYLDVEESVAIFLMIIGHSQGQWVA